MISSTESNRLALENRIGQLEREFASYLRVYDSRGPFTRAGQLEHHVTTMRRWTELGGDPVVAIRDEAFVHSLYLTLRAWGIGVRSSRLRPPPEFWAALRSEEERIGALSASTISDEDLIQREIDQRIWELIVHLDIVQNEARLVALTKTLHHILPHLVVPIDRAYTGRFFSWGADAMQHRQQQSFTEAFRAFNRIATAVDLDRELGEGWRMSKSKLIDNAIVGYCIEKLPPSGSAPARSRVRRSKYEPLSAHLAASGGAVECSFETVDQLVGGLPPSARNHPEWWANHRDNPQAAWLRAGKRVDYVSLTREIVRFVPL